MTSITFFDDYDGIHDDYNEVFMTITMMFMMIYDL